MRSPQRLGEKGTSVGRAPIARALRASEKEPLWRDDEGVGQGRHAEAMRLRSERIEHDFGRDVPAEEAFQGGEIVALGDEQKRQPPSVSERSGEGEQGRQLALTGRAPGRPEMYEHNTAAQRGEGRERAVGPCEREVGRSFRSVEHRDAERAGCQCDARSRAVGRDERELEREHARDGETDAARACGGRSLRHAREGVVARGVVARNRVLAMWCALMLALFTAGACNRHPAENTAQQSVSAQTYKGGPAAHPGDWCTEHGVPDSECTRCNAALIPQFQARHDWCDEHGMPDSQCPLCHPELARQGVVPPRPHAAASASEQGGEAHTPDGGIAPGTVVRLARPVVAERVGIETVAAESRALADEISVPVRLDFDPTRLARVSARVAGVVRSVAVDLGATVRAGTVLATLDSPVAAATRADVLSGRVRVANAEIALRRAHVVQDAGAGTSAEIEAAETMLAAARAELDSVRASSVATGGGTGPAVQVISPRAGVVVRRTASVGQQVTAEDVLVEVADLSTMLAVLDVPDADAPRLQVGQSIAIEMDGIDAPFHAALTWLSPVVDPHTRTVQARAVLQNPNGTLRANAFGRARIRVGASQVGVVVPRGAIQRVQNQDVVFVARSPVAYEARVVVIALRTAREARIERGVEAGEQVVTTGGFELKTELMRTSIGAGCCDDES